MKLYFDHMRDEINLGLLAKLCRVKRATMNIDLMEVSKKTKISASTLSRIENEKMPDVNSLFRICRWLNCPVENLRNL